MAEYEVAKDLHVKTGEHHVMIESGARSSVFIYDTELPALLARLEEAAAEMGVSTARAELVAALRGLLADGESHLITAHRLAPDDYDVWCNFCKGYGRDEDHMEHLPDCPVVTAQQALAKAEQR